MGLYIGSNPVSVTSSTILSNEDNCNNYQRVEYIESSGTQWIDTGYKPNNTTGVDFNFQYLTFDDSTKFFFGASNYRWESSSYGMCAYGSAQDLYCYANSDEFINIAATANTDYSLFRRANNYTVYTNGTFDIHGALSSTVFDCDYNMYLFASNWTGVASHLCAIRLYGVNIYEGSTEIMKLVPCYRKSDNEIGMYDLLNNNFYTNEGTGAFTKGQNIS